MLRGRHQAHRDLLNRFSHMGSENEKESIEDMEEGKAGRKNKIGCVTCKHGNVIMKFTAVHN